MKQLIYKYYDLPFILFLAMTACHQYVIKTSDHYLFDDISKIPKKKTALVLGASKYSRNGNLNPYFVNRMYAAADLYFEGKVEKILVSGDNHISSYDEPTDMANFLIELGVPKKDIILDYAGFRTLDSVVRAKKVFNCDELIIVSQKFHNQRAIYIARQYKIDAVAYNAKDVASSNNFTHYREILAKFVTILDVHLFKTKPKFL
ncbi:YdcF family protein [Paracrocinitomix mangrovi]|uniref:SanA/YdcF family protein n=1 Tax=Paracrocinitomix mangrovi TaxID=2862509 RepID=UPI001EDBBBB8|nr:ElyC/SanA/YdcF family protein [Paracrocinitomix mangrovi]UKN02949.1 YdcF family protein [Paracrocinitomix mangrovi]